MLKKALYYEDGDSDSSVFSVLSNNGMEKNASYADDVQAYVEDLKPSDGKTYALVNALSSGEYYGSNRNGDYFPEKALREYHKTFEALGHVYTHHVNKDPKKSMGRVKFASYNEKMHRVELILELDNEKAASVVEKLKNGHLSSVSMGCKVPWDECSICHNRAAKVADYCDHLKNSMSKVASNGEKVYAINTMPKFFDLSVVTIPADRTAGFISQVGNTSKIPITSAATEEPKEATWHDQLSKTAQLEAKADIKKKIIAKVDTIDRDPKNLILKSQKKLSKETIEKLSQYPLNEILSTFLGLRIMPLRDDFQKLALYSMGRHKEADQMEIDGVCFEINSKTEATIPDDFTLKNFSQKIAEVMREEIPEMALTKPLVIARELVKIAQLSGAKDGTYFDPNAETQNPRSIFPERKTHERSLLGKVFFGQKEEPELSPSKSPIAPLGILGSLYWGYAKTFNDPSTTGFRRFVAKHPWVLAMLLGTTAVGTVVAQEQRFGREVFGKEAADVTQPYRVLRNALLTVPASYYASGAVEHKARKGVPITKTEDFVRQHPVLVALGASMLGASAQRAARSQMKRWKSLLKMSSVVSRMDSMSQQKLYNDLILN